MFWIWTSIVVLTVRGGADVFPFDVSPLSIRECSGRPPNKCGPRKIRESDCAFLEPHDKSSQHKSIQEFDNKTDNSSFKNKLGAREQTYVTLHCDYGERSDNATTQDVAAQVRAIQKRSPRRAVDISLRTDALLNPEIFVPISHQTASLSIMYCENSTVTSRLPALNFTNLVDFIMEDCRVSITIRKSDFTHLQKIRLIRFREIWFEAIEPGTFTDLPDLTMFWIHVYPFRSPEKYNALQRLQCDPEFDWLWDWLDKNPGLQKVRQSGEVFRIGSLESSMEIDMLTRNCKEFATLLTVHTAPEEEQSVI